MADADFAFYGTTLHGIPQNHPRWKRAVAAVDGGLGQAVGKLYVEKHFPPDAKARMDRMVQHIIETYRRAFEHNDWMGPETRQKALAKLAMFRPKIGYPAKWRDYSTLEIRRDDLVGNMQRASAFEWNRMIHKLGKPVDRDEWHMTPQTVNAYYNHAPERDRLSGRDFAAALLQPRRRRRGELRRHRHGDRPRDRPRFRRSGLEVGRRPAICRTGGRRPIASSSTAAARPWRRNTTSSNPFRASTSTASSRSARTSAT